MSVDPIWLDFGTFKFGRPIVSTDTYDDGEWLAFKTGWQQRDQGVQQLADVGRRVLYGLSVGDVRPSWFEDRSNLLTLVTQAPQPDPPAAPSGYTDTQVLAFNAGWTARHVEVAPIYTVGIDVLAGLLDGRAAEGQQAWLDERDQLEKMLSL